MIVSRPFQYNDFENQRLMHMAMDYAPGPGRNEPAEEGLETYSIVIADDDRSMTELLANNLRKLGHRIVGIAAGGQEAIDIALKTKPDVVIMDIHMPGIDGFEAARCILASKKIPIVMSTGLSDARTIHKAIDLNVISYLVKPFSPAQLKVAVHLAVAQCRQSSPPPANPPHLLQGLLKPIREI